MPGWLAGRARSKRSLKIAAAWRTFDSGVRIRQRRCRRSRTDARHRDWRSAAARIGFGAHSPAQSISIKRGYQQLHDGLELDAAVAPRTADVRHRSSRRRYDAAGALDDRGIEYYRFVS